MAQLPDDSNPKDRPFDASKTPASSAMTQLVAEAMARVESVERRQRRRREVDRANHEAAVTALVCDLVHCELAAPEGWVTVPLAKAALARKARAVPFMTEAFARTVKLLRVADICELAIGRKTQLGGVRSTVRAGPWLLERIAAGEFDFGDIGRNASLRDPLLLRSRKVCGKSHTLRLPDTEEVRHLRWEMQTINAWIAQADLQWTAEHIDTGQRHLTRIFNAGSLQRGGRLFHGFWIDKAKNDRLAYLRIDGQPVALLDFGQMAIRLAYASVGVPPPEGDLYQVGVRGTRAGVKAVFNALLASDAPRTRFPAGTRQYFSGSVRFADVLWAISQRHPALVPLFGEAQALIHQNIESRVIVASLLQLRGLGVVVLPVHDSLLVGLPYIATAKQVLENTFKAITGGEGLVEVESLRGMFEVPQEKGS